MMTDRMRERSNPMAVWVALGVVLSAGSAAPGEQPADFKALIDRHGPAIVTVKFVTKVNMGMGDQESESEIPGVMVDPAGLVLVSNTLLAGPVGMIKRFAPPGMNVSSEPTDIKIILGADDEELDGKVLARDTDLDLAWVRIETDEKKTFAAVAFGKGSKLDLGRKLLCVRRLGKLYNRAPAVRWGRVCGETDSPRHLFVVNTELASSVGLPVFESSGALAGMVVMQTPDQEDGEDFNPMNMLGSMASIMEMFTGVVLPARQVSRATQRVRDTYMKVETGKTAP